MDGFEDPSVGDAGRIDYANVLAEAARYVARRDGELVGSRDHRPPLVPEGPLAGQDLRYPIPALDPAG